MTLQQSCAVFLNKMGIRRTALAAFDVSVHVIGNRSFDSLGRDTAFETSPRSVPRPRGTQFVEDVLVHVIFIPVHHGNHFVEVSENGVRTFDHDLRSRQSPTGAGRDFFGNVLSGPVKQALVVEVAHVPWPRLPPFKTFARAQQTGKH